MARSIGTTIAAGRISWEERALSDADVFRRGLTEIGLPADQLDEAMAFHESLQESLTSSYRAAEYSLRRIQFKDPDGAMAFFHERLRAGRRTIVARLHDWVAGRKLVFEDVDVTFVDVPIFVLASPRVRGSAVALTRTSTQEVAGRWSVRVLGVGLAASQGYDATVGSKLTSSSGHDKLVLQPVELAIVRVTVLKRGRVVGGASRSKRRTPAAKRSRYVPRRPRPCTALRAVRSPTGSATTGQRTSRSTPIATSGPALAN
jgi:hypothetical protein